MHRRTWATFSMTLYWMLVMAAGGTLVHAVGQPAFALEPESETFVLRVGAGVAIPTQTVLGNIDSDTKPASMVNFEGLYVVREWIRVGVMYQWVPLKINRTSGASFGSLDTHSVLPTVELRPTGGLLRDQWLKGMTPYVAFGVGMNFHTFKTANGAGSQGISFPTTLATRVAAGFDIPITEYVSFNAEVAWNRDSGHYRINGTDADFNASAVNALAGLRLSY